jgi:tetratricopeptide (TPR) repeat protein
MSTVFISYRRDDSGPFTARLYDRLCEHFGEERVFRDIDGMPPGTDFAQHIDQRITASDAVLAVIGRRWLTLTGENGQRRLDDPKDFVCAEIAAGLAKKKLVIPVLVDGARLPRADKLPASIQGLLKRHAAEVSDSRFAYDVERLVRAIEDGDDTPSPWRRLLRWLRQHVTPRRALAAAAALLVAAALVTQWPPGGVGGFEWTSAESVRADLQERRERLMAELAATPPGQSETRSLLERERKAIDERLADLPSSTVRVNQALQQLDVALQADPGEAARAARDALRRRDARAAREQLAAAADGTDAPQAAAAAFRLGELAYAEADLRSAYPRLKQAARLMPQQADYLGALGRVAQELGDLDAARAPLETALALRRQAAGATGGEAALVDALINLALLDKAQRRYADAEGLYREAIDKAKALQPPDDARQALLANNLAQLYRAAAPDTPEVRQQIDTLLRDALDHTRRVHGARSAATATALNNQAAFLAATGAPGEALALHESALQMREALLPPNHPDIAASLNNLAALHAGEGRPREAEPLYLRALAIQQRAFGADHAAVATTLNNLAQALHRLGRASEAEQRYRQALAIHTMAASADPVSLALVRSNLALVLLDAQRNADAEPLLRAAAETMLMHMPAQHDQVRAVVGNYVECLQRLNRRDEALAWQRRLDAAPSS